MSTTKGELSLNKFLIQTVGGMIVHDFCFHLVDAIKYNNWFYNETIYEYSFSSDSSLSQPGYIPVGSLEFVFDYAKTHHHLSKEQIHPINIPYQLRNRDFLKRELSVSTKEDLLFKEPVFIKSNTSYKSFTEVIEDAQSLLHVPEDEYLVSEILTIESEWRTFIHNGHLLGAKHYSGDFKLMPDFALVEKMISTYTDSPDSYTLDVGINEKGTFLIEVHPFVSCGLYGFTEYKHLPQMFNQGFRHLTSVASSKK